MNQVVYRDPVKASQRDSDDAFYYVWAICDDYALVSEIEHPRTTSRWIPLWQLALLPSGS